MISNCSRIGDINHGRDLSVPAATSGFDIDMKKRRLLSQIAALRPQALNSFYLPTFPRNTETE